MQSPTANKAESGATPKKKQIIQRESSGKKRIEQSRIRLLCVTACFVLSFLTISVQLVEITVFHRHGGNTKSRSDTAQNDELPPPITLVRGDIVDRNGLMIATSIPTQLLYANPDEINDPEAVAKTLITIFPDLNKKETLKKLKKDAQEVDIRHYLTPKEENTINNLGIPGLYFKPETKRVYPYRNLLSHIVGFVGRDNKGMAGLEEYFDKQLRDTTANKEPLRLSIDLRLQNVVAEEIKNGMNTFNAIGATGIVLDLHSGEILAMANLPDYDPNHPPQDIKNLAYFNRASLGDYEMGSTFKTFTTAMALDYGVANMNNGYDASRPLKYGHYTIRDDHPKNRWLTLPEIYTYSSNIGTARMVMAVGKERQQEFLRKVGLMDPVEIELHEVAKPHYPSEWSEISSMTISYGHGMSVTPLNLVRAFATIVNGGFLEQLTLMKGGNSGKPEEPRVISDKTSRQMRRLMRMVVEYGTGKHADVPGYRVGGKTGTAEKVNAKGGYSHHANLALFISTFPADDPQYIVLVIIDEPKGTKETHGFVTAGWIAAPIVGNIISRMAPMLGLHPAFHVPEDPVNFYWVNNAIQKFEHDRDVSN